MTQYALISAISPDKAFAEGTFSEIDDAIAHARREPASDWSDWWVAPMRGVNEKGEAPAEGPTLTLGEFRRVTEHLPDSVYITIMPDHSKSEKSDGSFSDYHNIAAVDVQQLESSLILISKDNFDSRQW